MAKTTSIALGDHFSGFINQQLSLGRYGTASEVIRAGLRILEEQEAKHQALQQAVTAGFSSGIADDFKMDAIQSGLDQEL